MKQYIPRNVALMMFNDHPEKFFPYLQVDITIFPKGKLKDPDNFIEVPPIKGPIDSIYRKTMTYLETNVIKENVQKRDYKPEADRAFNYPIHALKKMGIIIRVGSDRNGSWMIVKKV